MMVILTTTRGTVIKVIDDIFIGDLVNTIDKEIEYIEAYGNN